MSVDFEKLINLRKHLHSIPELSDQEKLTSRTIKEFLLNCNPTRILTDLGGHSIVATWDSVNNL